MRGANFETAVRDSGSVGECDMKSMLASARAIADQCRRSAEANQIGASRHQPGCAGPCGSCHRDCGFRAARLCRCESEKRRKRVRVIRNLRLDQEPGAARNTKQLAERPTAAPGDRECRLTAGRV